MTELSIYTEKEFLELAYSLGKPVASRLNTPLIDNLVPLPEEAAHKQSLSANYGIHEFPFHTDGAYFKNPPRFILLRYLQGIENPTPTTLCGFSNLNHDQIRRLQYDVWKVRSRTSSFYSSILSEDGKFLRYDRCVMTPINEKSNNPLYFEEIIAAQQKITINWYLNKTVVIDNWKYLHARPSVKKEETNFRKLQRIMVL